MDLIRLLLTVTLLAAATSLLRLDTILWEKKKKKSFAAELGAAGVLPNACDMSHTRPLFSEVSRFVPKHASAHMQRRSQHHGC